MTSQLEQFAVWVTSKIEELAGLSPEQLDCLGRLVELQKKQRAKRSAPATAGTASSLAALIREREGFDVELGAIAGDVPSEWPFKRGIQREHTVETWMDSRLAKVLPSGSSAKVLLGDGTEADGDATVGEVRASYKEKAAAKVRRPLKLGKQHANGVAHA